MADLQEIRGSNERLEFTSLSTNAEVPPGNLVSAECFDSAQQQLYSSAERVRGRPDTSSAKKECTMCGDVGIYEELFRCRRCQYRYQHIYCSRSYPNLGSEMCVCNWCLHEEDKVQELTELTQTNIKRKAQDVVDDRNNALDLLLEIAQSLPENGEPKEKIKFTAVLPKGTDNPSNTQLPKRHRCSHVAEKSRLTASEKWRQMAKNRSLPMTTPRVMGRRYKLLADVLC